MFEFCRVHGNPALELDASAELTSNVRVLYCRDCNPALVVDPSAKAHLVGHGVPDAVAGDADELPVGVELVGHDLGHRRDHLRPGNKKTGRGLSLVADLLITLWSKVMLMC